ncbi:hypothetical protein OH76DRAFT_733392 [Lentinus brumalis]|uniref:Uncharacterized protein n=1 Tax=Lentinus brumalis TaxID=2498619 RepID=A0A371DS70_9APHY|nr:hypothetical protein OH76DRAFT_733392 [Polyporus brumalis]
MEGEPNIFLLDGPDSVQLIEFVDWFGKEDIARLPDRVDLADETIYGEHVGRDVRALMPCHRSVACDAQSVSVYRAVLHVVHRLRSLRAVTVVLQATIRKVLYLPGGTTCICASRVRSSLMVHVIAGFVCVEGLTSTATVQATCEPRYTTREGMGWG